MDNLYCFCGEKLKGYLRIDDRLEIEPCQRCITESIEEMKEFAVELAKIKLKDENK